jgi:cytochrome b561
MGIRNTEDSYGSVSKFFHWFIALLVIGMLSFGFFMDTLPKAYKPPVYFFHKSTGLLILLLVVSRVVWTLGNKKPTLPTSIPHWQALGAKFGHFLLYLLLLAMPATGLLMSVASNRLPSFYGLFTVTVPGVPISKPLSSLMNQSHGIIAWIFIFLITGHVLAALRHHYIVKDDILKRMMPGK